MLLRANGELELLTEGGLLLGVLDDAEYECGSCVLGKGDTLLIYSDGITESRNGTAEGSESVWKKPSLLAGFLADAALFQFWAQ